MTGSGGDYLVVNESLTAVGRIDGPELARMTERHHYALPNVSFRPNPAIANEPPPADARGVLILLGHGMPTRAQMRFAARSVRAGRRTFFYWPAEQAVEVIDSERLSSLNRHKLALAVGFRLKAWLDRRRARAATAAAGGAIAPVATAPSYARAPAPADIAVLTEAAVHIGREADSFETHLRGGIGELRRVTAAYADQIEAQAAGADAQIAVLKQALSPDASPSARAAAAAAAEALEAARAGIRDLRQSGGGVADYIESGLPILERVRQQSAEIRAGIGQISPPATIVIAAPAVAASPVAPASGGPYRADELPAATAFLRSIAEDPRPVPLALTDLPTAEAPLPGTGVYLRLDFWAPLTSGGSYGHTCFQAKALAQTTQDFVAVMANRFGMLDDLGVRQAVVPAADLTGVETNILGMNRHYADRLGLMFETMRPAYIFERAVLGNAVGAWASRRFNIPYIVEYNGSEISMKRSFAGAGYDHEDLLLLAEDAAFHQASLISVVSDHVAADVARRGIPESRILVNPNAVDLAAYSPAAPEEREALRASLGFAPDQRVVGFIGTFGGWHGIDVLAASLQPILAGDPSIRVLLIGDGNLKGLVNEAIARHDLADRIVDVGRVPQARGAKLLKACDILVSPHSSNMIDSPFFGSPTKLFEYMAMGAGIVASDLEQIAHVLSPAVRPTDLAASHVPVADQRAVLCKPGDVDDFVRGVIGLVRDPAASAALGRNARRAAEQYYTWDQHVRNLWLRLANRPEEGYAVDRANAGGGPA